MFVNLLDYGYRLLNLEVGMIADLTFVRYAGYHLLTTQCDCTFPSANPFPASPGISRIGVARPLRRTCHRAIAGDWIRGVLEQYVAGSDTRGRPEGCQYYSRSLRSAQSRKRVPSFAVAVTPRRDEISGLGQANTRAPNGAESD